MIAYLYIEKPNINCIVYRMETEDTYYRKQFGPYKFPPDAPLKIQLVFSKMKDYVKFESFVVDDHIGIRYWQRFDKGRCIIGPSGTRHWLLYTKGGMSALLALDDFEMMTEKLYATRTVAGWDNKMRRLLDKRRRSFDDGSVLSEDLGDSSDSSEEVE